MAVDPRGAFGVGFRGGVPRGGAAPAVKSLVAAFLAAIATGGIALAQPAGGDGPQPEPNEEVDAEDQEEGAPGDLPPIVVTATRLDRPLSDVADVAQVIPRGEIEEINPARTGRLFEYVPGTSAETGTGSGLTKRTIVGLNGLPANYTLVLVDGVRLLSEHIHTGQNLELIPPGSVERIEIIRGASSAQYGSDAIGGVVNVITRKCGTERARSVGAGAGSYDTYQADVEVRQPLGQRARLTIFANHEQSDGVPLLAPTHRIGNMGYDRLGAMARLEADAGDSTKLFAWYNVVEDTMDWRDDTSDSSLQMGVVGASHEFGPSLRLFSQVASSVWDAEQSGERNELFQAEVDLHWRSSPSHTIGVGVDVRDNSFTRTAVSDVPDQLTVGGFVQDEWRAGDRLTLLASLRADHVEDIGSMAAPKLSAIFEPAPDTRVRCSIARGYHAPTLQELYEEGYGHGGTALRFGNPDLEPEHSTTFALAFERSLGPLDVTLYGHYSSITDMIVPVYEGEWLDDPEDPNRDIWRRTNIASARVYGAEILARYSFSEASRVEVGFSYTGNEEEESGRQLPYAPGSALFAKAVGELRSGPSWKVSGFLGVRCAFGRSAWNWKPDPAAPVGDPSGMITELEDYQNLEAGITAEHPGGMSLYVNVDNILGQDIENLDDAFTKIDGEVVVRAGARYSW